MDVEILAAKVNWLDANQGQSGQSVFFFKWTGEPL